MFVFFQKKKYIKKSTIDEPLVGDKASLIKLLLSQTGLMESLDDERMLLVDIDVAVELGMVSTMCVFLLFSTQDSSTRSLIPVASLSNNVLANNFFPQAPFLKNLLFPKVLLQLTVNENGSSFMILISS